MAEIFGICLLPRPVFCLLTKEHEEIEADDDNLSDEDASFLSIAREPCATKEPAEDIAVKVEAITSQNLKTIQQPLSEPQI